MPLLLALLSLLSVGCAAPGPDPAPVEPVHADAGCGRGGGWCGGRAPSGCWCDDACLSEGDCCGDATTRCPRPARLRVPPVIAGQANHPVFVDLAPDTEVEAPLELVVDAPEDEAAGTVAVKGVDDGVGRTLVQDGWRRGLAPLAWVRAERAGTVTLRLRTRGHPTRVLAEVEVDVVPDDDGRPSLTPCEGVGDVVVTRGAGRVSPVALTGRLEAYLRPAGWLELRHPVTDWRLGLGPRAKVLSRAVNHRTVATPGAARHAPKVVLPRGCPYGEVRLDALALSDAVDGVALAWRLTCDDGAQSDGCAWLGAPL